MSPTTTPNRGRYGIRSKALRGLFFCGCAGGNREQTSGAPGGPPPLGPCLQRGSKAALGFAPPPPGARLRWPGTPAPGQHQPHLIFGGQAWPPLARPPRCFEGGRCGGLLAVKRQAAARQESACKAAGGEQGGRPLGASNSPWAQPGVRTGRAGNLRPVGGPPASALRGSPPLPPRPGG